MKKFILIACIFYINNIHSQSSEKIITLDYANIEENCSAKSKYELLGCDGISIQWIYLNQVMLKSVPEQFIKQFSKKTKSKEQIKLISFGSELKGFKFTYKNSKSLNRIIVYGTVNKQPLILNIGSENELNETSDLNEFLKKIIKIKA